MKAGARQNRALTKAKIKTKKIRRLKISEKVLRKAIRGSMGVKALVAKSLGVSWNAVDNAIKRYPACRKLLKAEQEAVGDLAEKAIIDSLTQRVDLATASRTAQWLLSRARYKDRGFEDLAKKLQVEGGKNPLKIQQMSLNIDALGLPIEVRRQILSAIERQETADGDSDLGGQGGD